MADFRFRVPAETYMGPDTLLKLPSLLASYGSDRVLVVADPMLHEARAVDRVLALLEDRGSKAILFDEIPDGATTASAEDILRLARGARANGVVGLGGVRVLSAARAVAASAAGTASLDDWIDGTPPTCRPLPYISVPTTYRDPFLLTDECALTDARGRRARVLAASPGTTRAVILDPSMSTGLFPKAAAACMLDVLLQAIEGFVSARANFYSDVLLERAVALAASCVDAFQTRPDDPAVRADALRASFLTGAGLASSSLGLGTAVVLALNARFQVPKASLAAVVLPYMLEWASKSRLEKVAALAPLLGEDVSELTTAESAVKAVESVRTRLGLLKIPSRLKDFDLELERLVETAEHARTLDMTNHLPRTVSTDDVFDMMKTAY
ncbi:MAG TPA: iron-containing alcohol dehydrogenase [Spirochaetia bacterium]|nr:iron-containing alcohol dehydrogenase [Spirochaetales bacterium]HRY81192.1 iron-containing alcohol dehydrogenase [Spirochaetia bacterium]